LLAKISSAIVTASTIIGNSVGAVRLKTFWRDPYYMAGQKAYYHARVLQIPTPRY
jgi:hypothetical protein